MDDFPGLGWVLIPGIPRLFLEGPGEDLEEFFEGSVVLLFGGRDGFLKAVVAGNEDGVGCTHGPGLVARILLRGPLLPLSGPLVESLRAPEKIMHSGLGFIL